MSVKLCLNHCGLGARPIDAMISVKHGSTADPRRPCGNFPSIARVLQRYLSVLPALWGVALPQGTSVLPPKRAASFDAVSVPIGATATWAICIIRPNPGNAGLFLSCGEPPHPSRSRRVGPLRALPTRWRGLWGSAPRSCGRSCGCWRAVRSYGYLGITPATR
jgi:hypothetical protein